MEPEEGQKKSRAEEEEKPGEAPSAGEPTEGRNWADASEHLATNEIEGIDYDEEAKETQDEDVQIGENTKVWHFCHISKKTIIGKNCIFGQNVFVGENVVIGDNVKIQNNVSIFEGVKIENNVFCGPSVVFTNVKFPRSLINQKQNFLSTIVKNGCTIGANATIVCGITLGRGSFVGAGSVVTKNVLDETLVFGNPAKFIKKINK